MATKVVVELTSDEQKLLDGFRRAAAADEKLRDGYGKTGDAGKRAGSEIVSAMVDAGKQTVGSFDKQHKAAIAALRGMSEEGRTAAETLTKELKAVDSQSRFDQTIVSLEALGPEGQKSAEKIRAAFAQAQKQTKLDGLIAELQSVGDEGEAVADRMRRELTQSADESAASMDEILSKIREIDPTAANAGDRIKKEMAFAAEKSKAELTGLVEKLKTMGPVGKQMANKLEADFEKATTEAESDIGGIIARINEIDPAIGRNAQAIHTEIDRAAKSGAGAMTRFKESAGAQLASVAGSYVGIHQAIQTIVDLNRMVIATNKEAFEGLKGNQGGDRRLLQVAKDEDDFQALRAKADNLSTKYGIGRDESRNLIFSARSEGFEDTADFIAKNNQVISVDAQAGVAGQVPGLFTKETISGEQAINATLAGAADSRLAFEDIARSLPGAAEGGALAGAQFDETTAALAVLASRFKSADTAADRIKAFATKVGLDKGNSGLGRESLGGKGIIDAVSELQAMDSEKRLDFLGNSQEVNAAFAMLQEEMPKILETQKRVRDAMDASGTGNAPTAIKLRAAASDPRLRELQKVKMSENQLAVERERTRSVQEGMKQRAANDALTGLENQGASAFRIAAAEKAAGFAGGFKTGDTSGLVDVIGGNNFSGLVRDLNLSANEGDTEAQASLLAVRKLQADRRIDPTAMVSRDTVAEFMTATTGEQFFPGQVTDDVRESMTRSIDTQAAGSRGMARDMSVSFLDLMGGKKNPLVSPILSSAASEGESAADRIAKETLAAIKKQTAAIERSNEIQTEILKTGQGTQANTKPQPARPTESQRAAVAAANNRGTQQ